jgi:hypothetical protein
MVLYQCDKCDFSTKDKGKYSRHCNRKFPCKKKENANDIESIKEKKTNFTQNDSKTTQNYSNLLKNYSLFKNNHENPLNDKSNKIMNYFVCEYCRKESARKYNHQRHVNSCKKLRENIIENNNKYLYIKDLEEKTKHLEEKINELKNNKSVINNVVNYNYNYNITINAYGKENLDFLTDYKIRQLFGDFKDNLIVQLIKNIHCNPSLPENMNLFKPNKKDTHIMVFNGENWILDYGPSVIKKLITDKIQFLDNWLYKAGVSHDEAEILEQIQEKNADDDPDVQSKISIDLYNNKKLIEQNYNSDKI